MMNEDDYLILSDIHNFAVCPRRWALRSIEGKYHQTWRTVLGDKVHERAHDCEQTEKRGSVIVMRGLRVISHTLRICGECDVVEFHLCERGVPIRGYEGKYNLLPIEYKKGVMPRDSECDVLQLCAQAMCLEEMLGCEIPTGALFYAEIHRRVVVQLTVQLRERVANIANEIHDLMRMGHTPKPKKTAFCKECSLKDECMPSLENKTAVTDYIKRYLRQQ